MGEWIGCKGERRRKGYQRSKGLVGHRKTDTGTGMDTGTDTYMDTYKDTGMDIMLVKKKNVTDVKLATDVIVVMVTMHVYRVEKCPA